MPFRLTVFTPLLNAGTDLSPFDFDNGPRITVDVPDPVVEILAAVERDDHVSPHEAPHFQTARGWLWTQRDCDRTTDPLWDFAQTNQMAQELQIALACAYLAGCGENDYWRSGAQIEICAAYRAWQSDAQLRVLPPCRFNFRFAYPARSEWEPRWTNSNFASTAQLFAIVRAFDGNDMPRLWMAFRLWNLLNTLHYAHVLVRFQLAVSALETFYIAPNEGQQYIWSVHERLSAICRLRNLVLPANFWDSLRRLRNDITHRGGLPQWASLGAEDQSVLLHTERLLQQTLCWAFTNQNDARDVLDNSRWPPP